LLNRLSKKDDDLRRISLKICGNRDLAHQVLQDTYLKINRLQPKKLKELLESPETTDNHKQIIKYVSFCLKSTFIDTKRKESKVFFTELKEIPQQPEEEDNTIEQEAKVLEAFNTLSWIDKQFILQSLDKSYRKFAQETGVSYGFIAKRVNKAKELVCQRLKKD